MSRLAVNGCGYEVRVGTFPKEKAGPRSLLLVHGFTGSGRTWTPHIRAFRRASRTIAVDLLGHGRSDAPADPARHAVDYQAADLAAILGRLDAAPADVLGYSFGARVALQLALDSPASVRRLILESPSAGIADPGEREIRRLADKKLAEALEHEGIVDFVETWERLPIFASQAALPPVIRARLRAVRLANDPAGLAASLRGAGQGAMVALHDRLADLRCPTLSLCGSLDPARPRAEAVAARIPSSRLAVVEGAGHAIHLEAPRRFRDLVLAFLDQPDSSEAA